MRLSLRLPSFLLLCCAPGVVFAGDSGVVLEVGQHRLTLGDLELRLRSLPAYQVESLGAGPEQVKRAFVERVVVPELLFAEEARRLKLDQSLPIRIAEREVLRAALEADVQNRIANKNPVTDEDVASYYEKHRSEYEKPERIRLFRIVVNSEAEAGRILEQARKADLVAWRELARKHSTDQATRERGGDLGFVHPDGATDVPRVRVDPALYAAAAEVENGALVPKPVGEDKQFSIVWRRGSLDAEKAGVEQHAPRIRRLLEQDRLEAELDQMGVVESDMKTGNVELLERLELPAFGRADPEATGAEVRIEGRPGASARPGVETVPGGAR